MTKKTKESSVTSVELQVIKTKLVDLLYWIIIIFMWFAIIGTVLRALEFGIMPLNYLQGFMMLYLLGLFLIRNKITYALRSWLLLIAIFILGIAGILTFGLLSQGTFFLLLFIILTSIVINRFWGITALITSTLFLTGTGLLFHFNLLPKPANAFHLAYAPSTWILAVLIFTIVASITIIFWNTTLSFLTQKIETSNLHEENLKRINKLLSKEIEARKQTETLLKNQIEDTQKLNKEHQAVIKELNLTNKELEKSNVLILEAKEKAQAADQLKASFLSNMSHEIRTPMNAINGFTTLINSEDVSSEDSKRYLEVIQTSTNNLLHIINDIMNMAKLESGQFTLHPELFDLNQLIEELTEKFTREIYVSKFNKISFSIHKNIPVPCPIISDLEALRQIASKLIENAIKFTEEGLIQVQIELSKNGQLQMTVKDTGIGISKQIKDEIYESFRQLDGNSTRKYGGTGIGLSIVKALLELLNGSIEFASIPGKETIFNIRIPVLIQDDAEREEEQVTLKLKGISILVVGKNTWDCTTINQTLQQSNALLTLVEKGYQALEFLKHEHNIMLIISQAELPDISLNHFIETLKKQVQNVPLIIHITDSNTMIKNIPFIDELNIINEPIEKKDFLHLLHTLFN